MLETYFEEKRRVTTRIQNHIPILLNSHLPENLIFKSNSTEEGHIYFQLVDESEFFYRSFSIYYYPDGVNIIRQKVHFIDIDSKPLEEKIYEDPKQASLRDLIRIDDYLTDL